jgi:hypothetical protein
MFAVNPTNTMNQSYLLFLLLLTLGCQKEGKVSESDLSGKTFTAKMRVDSVNDKTGMLTGILAMTKIEYQFNNNKKGIYHTDIGSMVSDRPFSWSIIGDTLIVEDKDRTQKHLIKRTDTGFSIASNGVRLDLFQK